MSGRFIAALLTYIILTFAIAAGWHLALFKGVYDQLGIFTRREPLIALGLLSMVVQGAIIAYLFPRLRGERGFVAEGLRVGLLLGLFMGSNAVLAEAGKQQVSSLGTWLALEGTYYLVQFAIVGVAIAWVCRDRASGVAALAPSDAGRASTG